MDLEDLEFAKWDQNGSKNQLWGDGAGMATRGQQRLSRASFSRSLDKGIYGLTKTEAASTGPVRVCTRSFAGIAT